MLFPVVNYPLLLFLAIPVLYFVFACVCNIALGVPIFFLLSALRQGTAMCYNVSTALRTIVETMTFSMVAAISELIMKAMRKITCRRIYEVVAWLCFLLLGIYLAFAFLFAVGTIVVAAQALSAMWVSASIATPETISFAATFAVGLCFWIPFILLCCRHLLILYICRW